MTTSKHSDMWDAYGEEQVADEVRQTTVTFGRPLRLSDGAGGYTEIIAPGASTMEVDPIVQETGEVALSVLEAVDIRIGDLMRIPHNLFLS